MMQYVQDFDSFMVQLTHLCVILKLGYILWSIIDWRFLFRESTCTSRLAKHKM